MKNKRFKGDVLEWTNNTGSDVSSGDVVSFGNGRLGIACEDIVNTKSGSVDTSGVFSLMAKASDDIAAMVDLYYDTENKEFTVNSGSGSLGGMSVAPSGVGSATVDVKINF